MLSLGRCFALSIASGAEGISQALLGPRKRVAIGGIRLLSADRVRECLAGELPYGRLAKYELASCFLHHRTLAQEG